MKNPYDVLRMKEQELQRVRKELEALRTTARLLDANDSVAAPVQASSEGLPVVDLP